MVTLFIADDDPIARKALEVLLQKCGHEVVTFASGTELFEAIWKTDKPTIALIDCTMPNSNGVEICHDLAMNPPPHLIYTIIFTGRTAKSGLAFALDNGADDYVVKPIDNVELQARINVGIRLFNFRQQLIESNGRMLAHTKRVEALAETRAEQLIRADRLSTIGILSAGIVHEINNPATFLSVNIQTIEENLQLFLDALATAPDNEQKQKATLFISMLPNILNEMKNGIARIKTITDGLKTYAHDGSGNREWMSIEECIESALHLCTNKLKYHVTVEKRFTKTPPVYIDKYKVEQVLVNLFTNAVDAIEESGKDGKLILITEETAISVIVSVYDNGIGIPPTQLEKIFMPFYTTKPIGKGTGLGLSISRNIIKDQNGVLIGENHPDGGTLFKIVLPKKHKGIQ